MLSTGKVNIESFSGKNVSGIESQDQIDLPLPVSQTLDGAWLQHTGHSHPSLSRCLHSYRNPELFREYRIYFFFLKLLFILPVSTVKSEQVWAHGEEMLHLKYNVKYF